MRTPSFYRNAATFSWVLPFLVFLLRILGAKHGFLSQELAAVIGIALGGAGLALGLIAIRRAQEGDVVIMPAGIGILLSAVIVVTSVLVLTT